MLNPALASEYGMSWVDVTKRHLERESAEVREAGWGGLVAKPKDEQGFTAFIIARRLQYSLDRRVEVVGVRDVKIGDLSREQKEGLGGVLHSLEERHQRKGPIA